MMVGAQVLSVLSLCSVTRHRSRTLSPLAIAPSAARARPVHVEARKQVAVVASSSKLGQLHTLKPCTHNFHHPRYHEHEGGPGAVPGVRLLRGDRDGQDAGHVLPHRQAEVQDRGLHLLGGRQAAGHQGTLIINVIHYHDVNVLDRPEFTRTWRG